MTNEERKVLKLALEALQMLHDENMDYLTRNKLGGENNQCMVFARDVIKSIKRALAQTEQKHDAAIKTLEHLQYTYHGGEYWKPPLGELKALAQPEQAPVATDWSAVHEKLELVWYRELSADEGLDEVQDLINTTPPQRKPLTSQERDAKRWRFLMENSYDSESVTQFHVWEHSWEPHSQTGEPTEWKQRVRGIALIDFIDRAIEAAHGIKE